MNRALIRRWINEYLDGEIGLADKAELEQIMAAEPEVRREYMQLRRAGLLLGRGAARRAPQAPMAVSPRDPAAWP